MSNVLVIGDVHHTPEEEADCHALLDMATKYVANLSNDIDGVIFLGDQYNNHEVVSLRTLAFWQTWLSRLSLLVPQVWTLVGNHDQASPATPDIHAMMAHPQAYVVDRPKSLGPGVVALPYIHDPGDFLKQAHALKVEYPQARGLVCHQTFVGATYENDFPAKDGIDLDSVPFDWVISGHIHKPQRMGKLWYPGAPRWRTLSDAGVDRFVYVVDFSGPSPVVKARVATDKVCSRIWRFEDRPEAQADLSSIPEASRVKDRIRVDVYGPPEYVNDRRTALKAMGATSRGFPTRAVKAWEVKESEGIETAFSKFAAAFKAPWHTPLPVMETIIRERLGLA